MPYSHLIACNAWKPESPFSSTSRWSPKWMSPLLWANSLINDDTRISPPRACAAMRDAKMTFLPKKSSASLAGSNFKPQRLTELIRRGLAGVHPTVGPAWDNWALSAEQRTLVLECRNALRKRLGRWGKDQERYGIIHSDLMPESLLIATDGVRLNDFDDAGFGGYLYDPAPAVGRRSRRAAYVPPAALLLRPRLASPAAQLPVGHGIH